MRCPFTKEADFAFAPSLRRLFYRWKGSQDMALAAHIDVGHPSLPVARDSRCATRVVLVDPGSIPPVLCSIREPEIGAAIIQNVAVAMVDSGGIIGLQAKDSAVESNLRSLHSAHAALVEMPFESLHQRNIGSINHSTDAVEENFYIGATSNDPDSGRSVASPTLAEACCG